YAVVWCGSSWSGWALIAATKVPPDPAPSPSTGTSSPPPEQAAATSSATVAARAEARGVRFMGLPVALVGCRRPPVPRGRPYPAGRPSGGARPGPPGGPGGVPSAVGAAVVGRRGRRGQLDPEGRAGADLGADREAAAHRLDQPAGERQTDAGAVDAALGGVEPLERLEQPIEVLGGDARSGVGHLEGDGAAVLRGLHGDPPAVVV